MVNVGSTGEALNLCASFADPCIFRAPVKICYDNEGTLLTVLALIELLITYKM